MTLDILRSYLMRAHVMRRPRRRRIKTAWLPSDTFRALVRAEGLRIPHDLFILMPWGAVVIAEMSKRTGNARYE
jgi:hypothetical protein